MLAKDEVFEDLGGPILFADASGSRSARERSKATIREEEGVDKIFGEMDRWDSKQALCEGLVLLRDPLEKIRRVKGNCDWMRWDLKNRFLNGNLFSRVKIICLVL